MRSPVHGDVVTAAEEQRAAKATARLSDGLLLRCIANLLVFIIVIVSLDGGCSVRYLFHLAVGQARLLLNRVSLDDFMARPDTAEEQTRQLRMIREMTDYARQTLGLSVRKEYTTICTVDIPIFVMTAAPKDRLVPLQWSFPITGAISYLGFFRRDMVDREIRKLTARDYDITLRHAVAYSTLGWFPDPVFLSFLSMTEEQVARLIFHELAHRTVFIRGETEFNESFATFIGHEGCRRWLIDRHGPQAKTVRNAEAWFRDRQRVAAFVEKSCGRLEEIYQSGVPRDIVLQRRSTVFKQVREDWKSAEKMLETSSFRGLITAENLNNALLLALRNYDRDLDLVSRFHQHCGLNLARTVVTVKQLLERLRETPVNVLEAYISETPAKPVSRE